LNRKLFKTGLQGEEHGPMIADDGVGSAPPRDGLAKDVAQAREVLPIEAARPDNGPTVAVEDQHAVEPLAVDLHEIPQIRKPDLMRSHGLQGPLRGARTP
jgi:hypothetical protein